MPQLGATTVNSPAEGAGQDGSGFRRFVADEPAIPPLTKQRPAEGEALRLLSFNIQVGIKTSRYRQYVTKGWKHVLPHLSRQHNLMRIADVVAGYDLVALQEVDGGSLRSGFVNQVEYLATRAGFPHWYAQLNRDLGPLAQHGNGLLTRVRPLSLEDHKLPGLIPGRGAIVARLPCRGAEILVVLLHLSWGGVSRQAQLAYVRELIKGEDHAVVMGDMNGHLARLLSRSALKHSPLRSAAAPEPTWPAWSPALALDHVLVTPGIRVDDHAVLDCRLSDHRPVAVTLTPR
ncbi:MAG: endonuclease/exonuclease/phosphatase family protein [Gammaproteobacteria bacterium]|nr:endonuclease/exonuclease/phosphatase family protein [Gammaproteobacteria bacterium]